MISQNLVNYLYDKNIAILGFGLEGISTYNFIRKHLPDKKITLIDKKDLFSENIKILNNDKNLYVVYGNNYLENLNSYDLIIKTPGISFKGIDTSSFINKITSQLQLFLDFFDVKTIGITGSKGKSTTSSLIYRIIKVQNNNTTLLGNIGVPIFDYIDKINKDTVVILEISSHQLEYITRSPNISILLNIFEEHLDHYNSYAEYAEAKYNIFKFQTKDDYSIYNIDNNIIQNIFEKEKPVSNKIAVSMKNNNIDNSISISDNFVIYKENGTNTKLYNIDDERKLLGNHNLFNIMCALAVSQVLNLDLKKTISTINTFESLPHRMEFVGEFDGIKYYNDSIATIPEATMNCVESLKDVNTLIIGGMDRKIDYSNFITFLINSNVENIVCLPDVGTFIGHEIQNNTTNKKIHQVKTMEEAVAISKIVTKKNTICVLSPAAASYGFFTNFKERGDLFKRLVSK